MRSEDEGVMFRVYYGNHCVLVLPSCSVLHHFPSPSSSLTSTPTRLATTRLIFLRNQTRNTWAYRGASGPYSAYLRHRRVAFIRSHFPQYDAKIVGDFAVICPTMMTVTECEEV